VAAGTYTEAASINPGADLTLQGAGRDVTTWIAPADDVSRMYCITSALNGYTGTTTIDVSGFTFSVEDNVISDSGMAILINRAYDGPLYLDIHDNKFIETTTIADETANSMLLCHNRYAARVDGEAPVKIYNNLDYTNGGITMSNSQAFDIYNNTFDGGSSALYIGYGCPENTTVGNHHIYNNTFKNASSAYPDPPWPSVYFAYYGSGTGMTFLPSTIESNTFEDNDVAIGYSMESDITYPADIIRFNNFDNNTEAVRVFGTYATSVNAENNWWGDASGPTHPMNALGTGDAVSDNVAFVPWLDDTYDVGNPVYLVYIGEEGYESIQEAVDAAEPGDTITVGPGIYVGDIVISQNVTLVAPAGAKLEGTGLGPVVTIEDYTVTIEGFEIDPGTDGIYIKLISAGEVVTIQNVDIYRNTGHGINVGEVFGTLEVFNSNIYENNDRGINIDLVGEGGIVVINFNTIVGNDEFNSYYGLYVNNWGEGVIIDARYNWWGDVSGPEDPAAYEVTGYQAYGDKVSANVDFEPWLLEEVDPEVTPTTYDKTLALKDGWTLVSSNKEVATGTVWIGTTPLVDEELEEEATILAYKYTAGVGYTQVTLATQLTSVDAYYVKTIGGGGVGIIYSDAAPGVVTKNLGEGWNIISAASETMNAYTLLVQLRGTEIEVGITTLVVQGGYNQFMVSSFWPLVTDAEWEALVDEKLMLSPFGGFWVHMNTAKTFGVIPD